MRAPVLGEVAFKLTYHMIMRKHTDIGIDRILTTAPKMAHIWMKSPQIVFPLPLIWVGTP